MAGEARKAAGLFVWKILWSLSVAIGFYVCGWHEGQSQVKAPECPILSEVTMTYRGTISTCTINPVFKPKKGSVTHGD